MLTKLLVAPLFIAASAVAHPRLQHHRRADADVPLSSWSSGNLESYWRYKNRYNSLGCSTQTGTDFYTNCCYPLGASESLSGRPAECTPTSLSCGAPVASAATVTPAPETNTPTTDSSSSNNDNYSSDNYDESSLPYCAEGDDGYDDDGDDTYTDAAYNGGSSSSDTYTPPASSNSQPQPTDSGNSSNNSGSSNNNGGNTSTNNGGTSGAVNAGGHATWYYQNGNAGACGDVHADSDLIGAIDQAWYGDLGQRSQYCGSRVRITRTDNGRSVDIVVADVCPTCDSANSFDLSLGAFQSIGDLSEGYIPIQWSFI